MTKKKQNREIQKRIEYDRYKHEHPDECWCPENDVEFPEIPQKLDFNNPIQGDVHSNGVFKCLICDKNKPHQFPHA